MDMQNAAYNLNWISIFVSSISALIFGALWYSPATFGKIWQRELKMSDEVYNAGNPAKIFGGTIILFLLSAVVIDMFIGSQATIDFGASAGFMIGLAWVSGSIGINCLFERKSLKLFLIDSGYFTISYTLMGAILGAW